MICGCGSSILSGAPHIFSKGGGQERHFKDDVHLDKNLCTSSPGDAASSAPSEPWARDVGTATTELASRRSGSVYKHTTILFFANQYKHTIWTLVFRNQHCAHIDDKTKRSVCLFYMSLVINQLHPNFMKTALEFSYAEKKPHRELIPRHKFPCIITYSA
jgi:hypothetical protein